MVCNFHLLINILFFFACFISAEKITVHILPHSHDDPGWIKTFDEYFNDSIKPILSNTIQSLIEDPKRTFIYSEVSFFKPWYVQQTKEVQEALKQMIKEGRFEFVNGGWVMEDEAASHYVDALTQLRSGLEFLKDEFNITPHIGWFLDQFGHSHSHAYIYTQFGFDRLVLGRSHTKLRSELRNGKNMELFWKPYEKENAEIFTHLIHDYYCPPSSIRPFVDDEKIKLDDSNLQSYAEKFLANIRTELQGYRHNHYMLFYGCDFTFKVKDVNFQNIETLMNYMNKKYPDQVEIKYSTVESYFNEIEKEIKDKKNEFLRYTSDFLPYVENGIWTGYFTSRPYIKGKIRESSILFSISSKLYTEFTLNQQIENPHSYYSKQEDLQHAIALTQHHDAVTGTAKTYVNDDYLKIIAKGEKNVIDTIRDNLQDLFNEEGVTICMSNGKVNLGCNINLLKKEDISFGIFNPGVEDKVLITLEANYDHKNLTFDIIDVFSKKIDYDMYCVSKYKCYIYLLYQINKFYSFLSFKITNIKEVTSIYKFEDNLEHLVNENKIMELTDNIIYQPKDNQFTFKLNSKNNYTISLSHSKYIGTRDGAYLFDSNSDKPEKYSINLTQSFFYKGIISGAVVLRFEVSTLLVVAFYQPTFATTVSVLDKVQTPYSKSINILLQLDTNIKHDGFFYTDSSGMKMVKRKLLPKTKTGEAFYPINYAISLKSNEEDDRMVSLFNDRPEGATSQNEGSFYLMLNRWSTRDDNKGVGEKLFEPQSSGDTFEVKSAIMMKTDNNIQNDIIRNIVDNYFSNCLMLFKGITDMTKYYRYSQLYDIFIFPKNIKMEIIYVSFQRALIQFFNGYDEFFGHSENEVDVYNRKILSIIKSKKFGIKLCDVNGFNCMVYLDKFPKKGSKHLRNSFYNEFVHFEIEPMEFKVFEIVFN